MKAQRIYRWLAVRLALAMAVVLVVGVASARAAGAASFSRTDYVLGSWVNPQTVYQVGATNPNDKPLSLVDLNGDGKLDIVASSYEKNVIHVLLNNGNGTFSNAPGSPFPTCQQPDSILAGDYNGDGKPDLLVDCHFDARIELMTGDGNGGLGAPQVMLTGYGPMFRANIDGTDDVVFNCFGGATCWIEMLNIGHPFPLDAYVRSASGGGTEWGASVHWYASDCNGDELVTYSWTNPNPDWDMVVLAAGPPHACDTFASGSRDSGIPCCSSNPNGITTADLENNGFPDIVMSSPSGWHTITGWNPSTGVGQTSTAIPATDALRGLAVGDFNGDGKLDLAGVEVNPPNYDRNQVEVRLGQGSATQFDPAQTFAVFGDQQNYSDTPRIAVGDLNGDGKPDIVTSGLGGNNGINSDSWTDDLSVLLNTTPAPASGGSGAGSGGGGGGGSGGSSGGSGGTVFPGLTLHPGTFTVKNGAVTVSITCPPGLFAFCAGTDTLNALKAITVAVKHKHKLRLGSARFSIPAGQTKKLRIKLTKKALTLLAKLHELRALEKAVAHDHAGQTRTTITAITIKFPHPKHVSRHEPDPPLAWVSGGFLGV